MKIALYIDSGLEQLVLTPESEHERNLLNLMHNTERTIQIHKGTFYACAGGWTRQGERSRDDSTMIVLHKGGAKS